jgi:hypothetical protein
MAKRVCAQGLRKMNPTFDSLTLRELAVLKDPRMAVAVHGGQPGELHADTRGVLHPKRLHGWQLLDRTRNGRGSLPYRLNARGRERLAWLRQR